jgi:hypothetical protein
MTGTMPSALWIVCAAAIMPLMLSAIDVGSVLKLFW